MHSPAALAASTTPPPECCREGRAQLASASQSDTPVAESAAALAAELQQHPAICGSAACQLCVALARQVTARTRSMRWERAAATTCAAAICPCFIECVEFAGTEKDYIVLSMHHPTLHSSRNLHCNYFSKTCCCVLRATSIHEPGTAHQSAGVSQNRS